MFPRLSARGWYKDLIGVLVVGCVEVERVFLESYRVGFEIIGDKEKKEDKNIR